jgi:DNA-binding NtrC family response regulator
MSACLYVEDTPEHVDIGENILRASGFDDVLVVGEVDEARRVLSERGTDFDLIVIDMWIGADKYGGYEVLRAAREFVSPYCLFVIFTAHGYAIDTQIIAEAVNPRFLTFILKGELDKFEECARSVAERARQREILRGGSEIAVVAPKSKILYEDIERYIAPSMLPVLIVGPTGTGKEDVALKIHQGSGLPAANFRPINCAEFSKSLILSELFGYVKGAFTGADYHHLGVILEASGLQQDSTRRLLGQEDKLLVEATFERFTGDMFFNLVHDRKDIIRDLKVIESKLRSLAHATSSVDYLNWIKRCGNKWEIDETDQTIDFPEVEGGTLFLDEIADLDYEAQGALLRFLDGHGVRPVGYSGPPLRPRKVRVIAATNRIDILQNPELFRQDLFWRLAQGWIVERPALKERIAEAITAARSRALNQKGERYSGKQFDLDETAVRYLQAQLDDNKFSSLHNPLESGNFRNLLGLVDRACWIALADHSSTLVVTEAELIKAQGVLQLLEKKGADWAGPAVPKQVVGGKSIVWRATPKAHILQVGEERINFRGNDRFVMDLLVNNLGKTVDGNEIVEVYRSKSSTKDSDQGILTDINSRISKKLSTTPLRLDAVPEGPRGKTVGLQLSCSEKVIIE